MTKYIIRTTRLTVCREDSQQLFSETSTDVSIDDEAGGEFVVVQQKSITTAELDQKISIDPDEWPTLRAAIDTMVAECRNEA